MGRLTFFLLLVVLSTGYFIFIFLPHRGPHQFPVVFAEDDDEDDEEERDDREEHRSSSSSSKQENSSSTKKKTETRTYTVIEQVIQKVTVTPPEFLSDRDGDQLVDALDPDPDHPQSEYFTDDDSDGIANIADQFPGQDDLSVFTNETDANDNGIIDSYEQLFQTQQ